MFYKLNSISLSSFPHSLPFIIVSLYLYPFLFLYTISRSLILFLFVVYVMYTCTFSLSRLPWYIILHVPTVFSSLINPQYISIFRIVLTLFCISLNISPIFSPSICPSHCLLNACFSFLSSPLHHTRSAPYSLRSSDSLMFHPFSIHTSRVSDDVWLCRWLDETTYVTVCRHIVLKVTWHCEHLFMLPIRWHASDTRGS